MNISPGVPRIHEYNQVIQSTLFAEMEGFSGEFIRTHRTNLFFYSLRWSHDPLHHWSRQWEYPYVFAQIEPHLSARGDIVSQVLDAGSGITFFLYFIMSRFHNIEVTCCDRDLYLNKIFEKINKRSQYNARFEVQNLRNLAFSGRKFDIVYCISVLEHTHNYELIIEKVHNILKKNGLFVVTFDLSFDSNVDIPIDRANELLVLLTKWFKPHDDFIQVLAEDIIQSPDIVTTDRLRDRNINRSPWQIYRQTLRHVKSLVRLQEPQNTNLSCFCCALKKVS